MASSNNNIPKWNVSGDFDVCKCNMPCPCEFAQTPTYGNCDGIMAWHIRKGQYGETSLDGLNVLGLDSFTGNIWAASGNTKLTAALFLDEKGNLQQREALQMIFSGKAGELRRQDFAPINHGIEQR
jgi:hypothetical protein